MVVSVTTTKEIPVVVMLMIVLSNVGDYTDGIDGDNDIGGDDNNNDNDNDNGDGSGMWYWW